jgi:Flp pilus assembly protein TadG
MSAGRAGDQAGSLTVELVVITPVLVVLALTIIVFGRVSEARQHVAEASSAGAEAAAVSLSPESAQSGAAATAVTGDLERADVCAHPEISTDVSHFYPGGYVTVTVVCQVDLSDVGVPGLPGTTTVSASSTAPIDPYRSVQ